MKRLVLPCLVVALLVACGGSSSSGPGTASSSSSSSSAGAPACGLTLFTSEADPRCQQVADQACCDQEKACAQNADCARIVQCIDACPVPRKDACVSACAAKETDPGVKELEAIGQCSKSPAWVAPPGVRCAWPA